MIAHPFGPLSKTQSSSTLALLPQTLAFATLDWVVLRVYAVTAAVLVAYWDVLTGQPAITFLWIAPCSLGASLAAGCLFSLWKTRERSTLVLSGYAVAGLLPLVAGCSWLHYTVR